MEGFKQNKQTTKTLDTDSAMVITREGHGRILPKTGIGDTRAI